MEVVLVIHLFLAIAIIGLVLLQRSEGGGLGIGGGGMGNLASAKSAANILTRATAICAAGFFCTSLALAVMAGGRSTATAPGILEGLDAAPAAIETPAQTEDEPPAEETAPAAQEQPPPAPTAQ
jgi:preprotein translocase subunit SecG